MKFAKLRLDGLESRLVLSPPAFTPPGHHNSHHVAIVGILKFDASTNALILVVEPLHGPARRYKLEFASAHALHHAEHLVNQTVIIHGILAADNETITHARARKHK